MGIPGAANPLLAGASAAAAGPAYEVEKSIRLNDPDSAYFTRTFGSAGNRKTWTISCWMKNCVGNPGHLLGAWLDTNNRDNTYILINGAKRQFTLNWKTASSWHVDKSSNDQLRDPSAWQHVLIRWNTPDGTPSERAKVWINNRLLTWGGGYGVTDPGQNDDSVWNAACAHYIGAGPENDGSLQSTYFNGYIAEFHFIDGTALDPGDFTETNSTTGQLVPKEYTGSYGSNGFYLDFSDTSGNTATTLGKDTSGNSNNWTPTNINNAAGITYSASSRFTAHSGASQYLTNVNANMFDSSENTYVSYANGNQPNSGFTWSATGAGLSGALTVKTYGDGGNPSTITVVHGGGTTTVTNTAGSVWSTIGTLTGIVSIDVNRHDQGICHGIKIGGVLITDGSASDQDSVRDSPTNGDPDDETGAGGIVPGNYCTWNSADWQDQDKIQLSNGNLTTYRTDSGWYSGRGTFEMTSGKWYFECTAGTNFSAAINYNVGQIGISKAGFTGELGVGGTAGDAYVYYNHNGHKMDGDAGSAYGDTWSSGDVIGVAFDADNGKIWFAKNNTWQASGNPATGANPAFSSISGTYYPGISQYSSVSPSYLHTNFGQMPFIYTAPTGFKPLATPFLPDPPIAKPEQHFKPVLYTGNGSSKAVTGFGFDPDWVWVKRRDAANGHNIFDQIRGATKYLSSPSTNAEGTGANELTSFDSDGFTYGSAAGGNHNGGTYVAWGWEADTATSGTWGANSKAYSRRTNATAGFSIIKFVADGSTGIPGTGAIPHGLGGKPDLVISKRLDSTGNWWTGFDCLDGSFDVVKLESTDAKNDESYDIYDADEISNWGCPDSSDQIYYVFKNIAGYSRVGIYEGNNSTDGTFVHCGFRPAYVWTKSVDNGTSRNWQLLDTTRDTDNVGGANLFININNAETAYDTMDILSNGFKLRSTGLNSNAAETYLYMAIAEQPFKYARAR